MVASPPRRPEGDTLATPDLGDLISEAVRAFAEDRGWGSESYDLWYHGEPVWYVRRDRRDEDADVNTTRTLRVQAAFFTTSAGPELVVMPDAFVYDWKERRITLETTAEWSSQNRSTAPLPAVQEMARDQPDEAKRQIRTMIELAWRQVEDAWDNLGAVQMMPVPAS